MTGDFARRVGQSIVVGNPSTVEDVPSLPSSAAEAKDIHRLYGAGTLLTAGAASRTAFLKGLETADLVHFAGHAVIDPDMPDLSRLLLADDRQGRGSVYAHEIEALRLPRAPVVVLAGCETAAGRTYRGEGSISLARAFLRAGALTVVATLWPLEDDSSRALFVGLHQHMIAGLPPHQALRRAQLSMLTAPEPHLRRPAAWASTIAWMGNPSSIRGESKNE